MGGGVLYDRPRAHSERSRYAIDRWRHMGAVFMSEARYFEVAGVTLAVRADRPIDANTFHQKFENFEVDSPGGDVVEVHHHFGIPSLERLNLGPLVTSRGPWEIHNREGVWAYVGVLPGPERHVYQVILMDEARGQILIHNEDDAAFERGGID